MSETAKIHCEACSGHVVNILTAPDRMPCPGVACPECAAKEVEIARLTQAVEVVQAEAKYVDRVLRHSIPDEFRGAASVVGAVQNYIGYLQQLNAEHEQFRHQHRDCDAMGVENQHLRAAVEAAKEMGEIGDGLAAMWNVYQAIHDTDDDVRQAIEEWSGVRERFLAAAGGGR